MEQSLISHVKETSVAVARIEGEASVNRLDLGLVFTTEVADEKEALRANLVKHVLDQLPNALQAALPAFNAYPNDPGALLLTVTAALIDRNPDQALRFLHRFTKNWRSLEYEDQLLRAIALARQGHWLQAAMIGKQVGWPNLFGAFIHLPGSWALRDWAHG